MNMHVLIRIHPSPLFKHILQELGLLADREKAATDPNIRSAVEFLRYEKVGNTTRLLGTRNTLKSNENNTFLLSLALPI